MKRITFIAVSTLWALCVGKAAAQSEKDQSNFLYKQCDEHALGFRLDPEPFQALAGPEFPLVIEDGKAILGIIIQDCSQYWVDGENLGPNKHAHVWVQIKGTREIQPVVGAEITLPTLRWFSIAAASTNPRDWEARKKSGTSPVPIEEIDLDLSEPNRGGKVDFADGLAYSWRVSSEKAEAGLARLIGSAQLVGVNHIVYVRTSDGRVVIKRIQALANMTEGPNTGMLSVFGATDPSRLVTTGTYPIQVYTFTPVWVQETLGWQPPEELDSDR